MFVVLSIAACGGSAASGNITTYTYPSESMEPTISYHEQVTVDLDAYKQAAPAVGDIVAFHPSPGANVGECGVDHPTSQPCPRATSGQVPSEVFMKRIRRWARRRTQHPQRFADRERQGGLDPRDPEVLSTRP
jgi:Signal peptidase, peptidase S26